MHPAIISVTASLALCACSPMLSSVQPLTGPVQDGVAYYMPRQPFKLTVSLAADGTRTPSVDTSPVLPDFSRRFRLHYNQSPIAGTHFTVGISALGLLNSTDAVSTSGVGTILANLAQAAADVSVAAARSVQLPSPVPACAKGQAYSRFVFPEHLTSVPLCGYTIAITRLAAAESNTDTARLDPDSGDQSGIFYKQQRPYQITFSDTLGATPEPPRNFVAFSPDESPIFFMPVVRGFFADNETKLTLTDGMLTNVDATTKGEAIAASAIPAQVIEAYFKAVGAAFGSVNANTAAQTTAIQEQEQRSLAIAKQQVCAKTIAGNPIANKTGDVLQAALTAISAACS